jgi:spore germination cell wall hydrolase CwlJ-like protein
MWRQSQEVAMYVLENKELLDITDGATHYHADYIENPRWAIARHKTMQIDTHIFYNKNKKHRL